MEAGVPSNRLLPDFLDFMRIPWIRYSTEAAMKVVIGCDHAGLELKLEIITLLKQLGIDPADCGTNSQQSVDYPDFGERVSGSVSAGEAERGILICGTGIGMSIVANKFPDVRAALCNDLYSATMSRLHNDANVLIIGGRVVGKDLAKEIVRTWFSTPFEGGRHVQRLEKIRQIEERVKGRRDAGGTPRGC